MRELIRGGMDPQAGQVGVSPRSDLPLAGWCVVNLPLNRILYIPFSIFVYLSNIVKVNFVHGFYTSGGNLDII